MATQQQVEDVTSPADKFKLGMALLLVVAGVVAYYQLPADQVAARIASVVGGVVLGLVVAYFSTTGRRVVAFAREAYAETRRVVWPDKKETWMMTLYVFAFVVVMAAFLWIVDKALEWVLYDLVLRWSR